MEAIDGRYDIKAEVLFEPLQLIDVGAVGAAQTPWWNRTLCEVNDAMVRLGVLEGDFHRPKHDREDEFFYVVEGKLLIDLEGRTVALSPQQGFTVAKGVMHRTRTEGRCVVMMIEQAGVEPIGG